MGNAVVRINDMVQGICNGPGHPPGREFTGVFVSGSGIVSNDNSGIVCVGDPGITDCNHHFTATTGSGIANCDGAAVHLVGDVVTIAEGGQGTTITGSDILSSD